VLKLFGSGRMAKLGFGTHVAQTSEAFGGFATLTRKWANDYGLLSADRGLRSRSAICNLHSAITRSPICNHLFCNLQFCNLQSVR